MFGDKKVSAILLAGGAGRRMGSDVNKVFLSLRSMQAQVLFFPLAALCRHEYVDEIIIVCRAEDREDLDALIGGVCGDGVCGDEISGISGDSGVVGENLTAKFKTPIKVVVGGENRYDSVYNGLLCATGDIALIHDGARPILKRRIISDCVEAMEDFHGAIVGLRNVDRLCSVDESGLIVENAEFPENVFLVQTPQCFHTKIIKECHEKVSEKSDVKDDSTLLELCGYKVKMLPGDKSNIKITYSDDLDIIEHYIQNDEEMIGLLGLAGEF